jgi:hypothetical protein
MPRQYGGVRQTSRRSWLNSHNTYMFLMNTLDRSFCLSVPRENIPGESADPVFPSCKKETA